MIIISTRAFSIVCASTYGSLEREHQLFRYVEMTQTSPLQFSMLHSGSTFLKQQEQLRKVITKIPKEREEAISNYFESLGLKECRINGFKYGDSYQFMINTIDQLITLSDNDFHVLIQFPYRQTQYNEHPSIAILGVCEKDREDVWRHAKRVYADHPDIADLYNFDDIIRGISVIPIDARSFILNSSYKDTKLSWLRIAYNIRGIGDKDRNLAYYTTHMYQFIPFLDEASFVQFFYRYQLIWGKSDLMYSDYEWDVIKTKIDHNSWDCRLMPTKVYFDHALAKMNQGQASGLFTMRSPDAYDYLCYFLDTFLCFQGCDWFAACIRFKGKSINLLDNAGAN